MKCVFVSGPSAYRRPVSGPIAPIILLFAALLAAESASAASALAGAARKPNIIVVLFDDLGGRELGCYGNAFNETPRIDKLASEGMKFTRAYSAAPICSPSRATIMTGQMPVRHGITDFLEDRDDYFLDPAKTVSIAKTLKAAGYHTGMIGKWHLTGDYSEKKGTPKEHGFDEAILTETSYIAGGDYRFPYAHIANVKQRIFPEEDLTERLNLEALDYIERNKAAPFFLYLAHYAVHTKLDAPDSLVARFKAKRTAQGDFASPTRNPTLAAMERLVDDGVGEIEAKLKALGLDSNTLVIVTSDNGGEPSVTDNGELRAGKGNLYEGGIRIPFLARWPGVIPMGKVCDRPIGFADLYPTCTALAGGALPAGQAMDGVDLEPLLSGTGDLAPRSLVWHFPQVTVGSGKQSSSAILDPAGKKLIRFYDTGKLEIYDVGADISEEHDLAPGDPLLARDMADRLFGTIGRAQEGYVYSDDFNDKDEVDWKRFGGAWSTAGGAYSVDAGEGFRAITDDRYFGNVVYQAKVTVGPSGNAGLILRAGADGIGRFAYRGYCASISAATGMVVLSRARDGKSADLGSKDAGIVAGKPYRLRVVATGSRLKVFVNDTASALISATDTAFDGGLIGLRAHQGAATFDDVYARGLAVDDGTTVLAGRPVPAGTSRPGAFRMEGTWLFAAPAGSNGENPRLFNARGTRFRP